MLLIELCQPRARQLLNELPLAEERTPVRMRGVADLVEAPQQELLGVILDEIHLLEDDLLLVVDLVGREARVGREVGQQLDAGAQMLDGHHEVVVRRIVRRVGIARSAEALDHRVDRARWAGRRPLEQHVLDVVGQAELVGGLVAAAHPHPELERDDVARAMLLDDQDDAVGQYRASRLGQRDRARAAGGGAPGEPQQGDDGCGAREATPHQWTPLST